MWDRGAIQQVVVEVDGVGRYQSLMRRVSFFRIPWGPLPTNHAISVGNRWGGGGGGGCGGKELARTCIA